MRRAKVMLPRGTLGVSSLALASALSMLPGLPGVPVPGASQGGRAFAAGCDGTPAAAPVTGECHIAPPIAPWSDATFKTGAPVVSADGSSMAGVSSNSGGTPGDDWEEAFFWSRATGTVAIGVLGDDGGYRESRPHAISADGSVVVGETTSPDADSGAMEAFRWTATGGMQGLGFLNVSGDGGQLSSKAVAVSADGRVVVGNSWKLRDTIDYPEAFRWIESAPGTLVSLAAGPSLPGDYSGSEAVAISDDGSVVAGTLFRSGAEPTQAFRWTDGGGMVGLPFPATSTPPAGQFSQAYAMSANGNVIVGEFLNDDSDIEAFRWTLAGGTTGLGFLDNANPASRATHVSADGTTVVGTSSASDPSYNSGGPWTEAFIWSESAPKMTGLGYLDPANRSSRPTGISADGSVVVGASVSAAANLNEEAFRWTEPTGMQSVSGWLEDHGVDMTGIVLLDATGVSADGSVVVGAGIEGEANTRAWMARGKKPAAPETDLPAFITLSDALGSSTVAAAAGTVGSALGQNFLYDMSLAGNQFACGDGTGSAACGFTTFDINALTFNPTPIGFSGSLGAMYRWAGGVTAGAGASAGKLAAGGLYNGGSVDLTGYGGGAFVAYAPAAGGVRVSLAANAAALDATIERVMMNGAAPERHRGRTGGSQFGIEVRLGYQIPATGRFKATPFLRYRGNFNALAGYAEDTLGTLGTAARVAAQNLARHEAMVGLGWRAEQVTERLDLWGDIAAGAENRMHTGGAIDLGTFGTFGGAATTRTQAIAEATFGGSFRISTNVRLHASLGATQSFGAAPETNVRGRVGLTVGFWRPGRWRLRPRGRRRCGARRR